MRCITPIGHVSNDKVQVKYTTSLIKKPRKQFTLDVVTPNMEVVNRNAPSCCPQPFTGIFTPKDAVARAGHEFFVSAHNHNRNRS
jgi:hypothetical protein